MFYGPLLYLTHYDNVIVAFSQLLSSSLWVLTVPSLRALSASNKSLISKVNFEFALEELFHPFIISIVLCLH